jgi:D-aminopeptidase
MKKIISISMEALPSIHFKDLVDAGCKTYIAIINRAKNNIQTSTYMLQHESDGYIFRDTAESKNGHSGWHSTIRRCIEKATEVGNTEVFVFDSINEAALFITNCYPVKRLNR